MFGCVESLSLHSGLLWVQIAGSTPAAVGRLLLAGVSLVAKHRL